MNGKFEDKLAQLAFGDLSPEEGARLEREVQGDPEAVRALSLYKDMREGLRSLSDIPEDQFSKERLRDAILTQGLRPVATKPVSNRGWLWMPATACAMGFGLMLVVNLTHRSNKLTQVVLAPDIPAISSAAVPPIKVAEARSESQFGPFGPPKPNLSSLDSQDDRRSDPNEVDRSIKAYNPSEFDEGGYDPDLGTIPPVGTQTSVGATTVAVKSPPAMSSSSSSGPIILIEQDKDEQTGALKATEVGSSSNVLVGG